MNTRTALRVRAYSAAMPGGNVATVRGAYAALAEGGVDSMLAFAEVTTPAALASEPDTYKGHEGVRRWFASFGEAMDGVRLEGD